MNFRMIYTMNRVYKYIVGVLYDSIFVKKLKNKNIDQIAAKKIRTKVYVEQYNYS